jgi:hypothetical protein
MTWMNRIDIWKSCFVRNKRFPDILYFSWNYYERSAENEEKKKLNESTKYVV